jgi:HD-like signal output (HDOD) protein
MNAAVTATLRKLQHPAFAGLNDKQLVSLCALAQGEQTEPGTWLLRPGDSCRDDIHILAGSGRVQLGEDSREGLKLGSGATLAAALYLRDGSSCVGLRAETELSVLRIDNSRLAELDPETQLLIAHNLAKLSARLSADLLLPQLSRSNSQQLHAQQIQTELQDKAAYYSASRPIVELLRKLPRLPSYATRLTQIMSDPNFSTKEAFETAKLDPSLTASVLKTVNSSAFSLKHKVMDFQHAFVLLGFNQIQQIIMNSSVQSVMPKTPEFQQLQLHSVMVSALCHEIALTLRRDSPAVLGTIGLLHDIGKSVVLLLKREHPNLGFLLNLLDQDLLGSMLLREWEIPQDIHDCLQYQSLPYQAPPYVIPEAYRANLAILYLAHLCHDFLMEKQLDTRQLRFCSDYLRVLGAKTTRLEDFIRDELLASVQPRLNNLPKIIQNVLHKGLVLTGLDSAAADEAYID